MTERPEADHPATEFDRRAFVKRMAVAAFAIPVVASFKLDSLARATPPKHDYWPNQTFPNQTFPNQTFPNQTFPNQTFPNQHFPNQHFPNQHDLHRRLRRLIRKLKRKQRRQRRRRMLRARRR